MPAGSARNRRIVLIAPGNALRGDDAIGPLVAQRVAARLARLVPRGAKRRLSTHTGPLDALSILAAWSDARAAFVIDAARGGRPPGTLLRFEPQPWPGDAPAPGTVARPIARPSSHGQGLHEAIELGRALSRLPGRLVCYAIEAAGFEPGSPPSDSVRAAIDVAAARIADEILAAWHHRQPAPRRRPGRPATSKPSP